MYFLLVAEFKCQWSASLPSNHNYGDYGEIFLSELISSKYCKISQLSQIGSEVVRLGEWLSQGNFLFGGIKLPNLPRLSISRNMIFTGIRFDYQISVNKKIDWARSQKYWSVLCFSSSVYQTDKRRGPSFRLIAQDKSMGTPSFFALPLEHLIKGLKCFLELSLKGVKVFSRAKKAEQANISFYTIMFSPLLWWLTLIGLLS